MKKVKVMIILEGYLVLEIDQEVQDDTAEMLSKIQHAVNYAAVDDLKENSDGQ